MFYGANALAIFARNLAVASAMEMMFRLGERRGAIYVARRGAIYPLPWSQNVDGEAAL